MPDLIVIRPQPEFPAHDLSDENAEILELMMANQKIVRETHEAVEGNSLFFQMTHPRLLDAAGTAYNDGGYSEEIDHGMMTIEGIAGMVGASPSTSGFSLKALHHNLAGLKKAEGTDSVRGYIEQAVELFGHEMPRTNEVVAASAKRLYPSLFYYSLVGAALARQFHIDNFGELAADE